jgi:Cu-Zn family superoxide dismutase
VRRSLPSFAFLACGLLAAASVTACRAEADGSQEPAPATATIRDLDGNEVGTATLTEGAEGVVVAVELHDLPAGTHALHVHETGLCEPPFDSAGGHAKGGGKKHGILSPGGMHEGDLPNVHVPESGSLRVDAFAAGATLGAGDDGRLAILDDDGAAIVLHAGADDYATDPAGAAGDRIACGVITG